MSISEGESSYDILCLNFNQTATALSVGTKNGYMLYDLNQVEECNPTYETKMPPADGHITDVCIIERNFNTSLIAYVTLNSPRKLLLYNYNKGQFILQKLFTNTVLSVKLNRKNVVVCLEDSIHILELHNLNADISHAITNTAPNLKGLIALTYGNENSLLAYPASSLKGDVQIFDALSKHAKITIPAHTNKLAALAFNENGLKLATGSTQGTIIRVFNVSNGQILFEFRRGVKRCVDIHSLAFNKDGDFICMSSNTETVHIFKLCHSESVEQAEDEAEGWVDMFSRYLTTSVKYLPTQVSEVLTQQRSFAFFHLPFVSQRTVCAISRIQNNTFVMVASLEGFLYIYKLDSDSGGNCILVKQHRLEGPLRPSTIKTKIHSENFNTKLSATEVTYSPKKSAGQKTSPAHLSQPNTLECKEDSASNHNNESYDDLKVNSLTD